MGDCNFLQAEDIFATILALLKSILTFNDSKEKAFYRFGIRTNDVETEFCLPSVTLDVEWSDSMISN